MRIWRIRRLAEFGLAAVSLLISVSVAVAATTRYVDVSNLAASSPYTNWSSAAVTIQDAIDVAVAGDQILVTNGIYQTGGHAMNGILTNRVAIYAALAVRSVNGPDVTIIRGYQVPTLTNGDGAVRCAWLDAGASLAGFTLTGGATLVSGTPQAQQGGGGVWASMPTCVVSNCVLTGNSAAHDGGGAYNASLIDCVLSNNVASRGGGAYQGNLTNCTLTGNSASANGGGAYADARTLQNCVLTGNSASTNGGGVSGGNFSATLQNCVLTGNSAASGGGAYRAALSNCTLTGNVATDGAGPSQAR